MNKKSIIKCVRDRKNLEPLQKEIWVLVRAPLFWVMVWSRDLFFMQKNKNK